MWPRCILYIERFKFYNTLLSEHNRATYIDTLATTKPHHKQLCGMVGGHIYPTGTASHSIQISLWTQTALYAAYSRIESSEPFQVLNWRAKEFGRNAVLFAAWSISLDTFHSLHTPQVYSNRASAIHIGTVHNIHSYTRRWKNDIYVMSITFLLFHILCIFADIFVNKVYTIWECMIAAGWCFGTHHQYNLTHTYF